MIDIEKLSPVEKEIILVRRAYKKEWRAKNADKVRQATERFYKKQAEKEVSNKWNTRAEIHDKKTAHWDINTDGFYPFCSHCGEAAQHMTPHCPNCGAKMITRRHGE